MRSRIKRLGACFLLTPILLAAADLPYYSVLSEDQGAWPAILSSIGLQKQPAALAHIFVARTGAPASPQWNSRVDRGGILIVEGESSLSEMFGFRRGTENVRVNSLTDSHSPKLPICMGEGLGTAGFHGAGRGAYFRPRTLVGCAAVCRAEAGPGSRTVDSGSPGGARLRALSVSAGSAARSRHGDAVSLVPPVGPSSILPTGRASIWITLRCGGASQASRRCTWPHGISMSRTPSATDIWLR